MRRVRRDGGHHTILTGDVREMLGTLPSESVHCCVTSPPYWGLRDYGTPPQVWGGEAGCEHEWGPLGPARHPGQVEQTKWKNAEAAGKGQNAGSGQFCRKCRAWLGSLGLEPTPELYVEHVVAIFREVRRVLRRDGTLWLNMGDCYASGPPGNKPGTSKDRSGLPNSRENLEMRRAAQAHKRDYGALKPKDLVGVPWRVAFALQADGWYLRSDVIWAKPNPMPESCRDRPTKAHEYVFMLTKNERYFFDQEAVRESQGKWDIAKNLTYGNERVEGIILGRKTEPHSGLKEVKRNPAGRNIRSVWTIPTQPFPEAHFATFPERLPETCIKAGTSERGCCPSCGAPWVRVVKIIQEKIGNSAFGNQRTDAARGQDRTDVPQQRTRKHTQTSGWYSSCSCAPAPPAPCVVLDPFVGSGTTAIVAVRLGRRAVGIDLSEEYTSMIEKQLAVVAPGAGRRPRKFRLKGRGRPGRSGCARASAPRL